jgi:hypothetical protein
MRAGRAALAVLLGLGTTVVAADPAGAHGVAGIQPSNFATRVLAVSPAVRGLQVRVADLGNKLELDNHTGRDVVVLGYDEEPYLRVGPAGVFENVHSPAVYLNRTRTGNVAVPATANSGARPQWSRLGGGTSVRWHDHRAHWLATTDPPEVRRDPGSRHRVQEWTVTLLANRARIQVRGDVEWVPGPSPWIWVAVALGLALAVIVLAGTRLERPTIAASLLVLIVGETAHVFGSWAATSVAGTTKLAASAYALGGIAVAVLAFVWVVRRGVRASAPLLLLAGLFLALAGGLADVSVLYRSQLPTTLPATLARLEVTATIGLGVGLAVVGALRLRPTAVPQRRPVPTPSAVAINRQ